MRTLTVATGSFDRKNSFKVDISSGKITRIIRGKLYLDDSSYGIESNRRAYWVMQPGGVISDSYTAAEREEVARLTREEPVRDGELVRVSGDPGLYRIRVNGDYSDCAALEEVK